MRFNVMALKIFGTFLILCAFTVNTPSMAEEPAHLMIDRAYFYCEKDHAMRGGIFGKGPTVSFGPSSSTCRRPEWKRLTHSEFMDQATDKFSINWNKELVWWRTNYSTPGAITKDGSGQKTAK